jgi:hypothetical protein
LFLFAVFAFVRLSVVFAFVRACGCVRFVSVVFGLFLFCGFRVRAVFFFFFFLFAINRVIIIIASRVLSCVASCRGSCKLYPVLGRV